MGSKLPAAGVGSEVLVTRVNAGATTRGVGQVSILATREGWFAAVLLLAMVTSTVASVDQGKWASGTDIVYGLVFGAFLTGGVVFHARLATPIALLLGTLVQDFELAAQFARPLRIGVGWSGAPWLSNGRG